MFLFICFSMRHNGIFNRNYNNTNNYKYFSFDINIKNIMHLSKVMIKTNFIDTCVILELKQQ
jgi:hypothetical protein